MAPCQHLQEAKPNPMKLKAIVHRAEEGGFWAEVAALPGCVTEGDTMEELLANVREAIEAWLSATGEPDHLTDKEQVVEIAI